MFLHERQESPGVGAVNEAMIVPERDVAHRTDRDRIVDDHRSLFDRANTEDGDLRLVDQWKAIECAKDSRVGDGERSRLHFFRIQLLATRAVGDIVNRARQPEQVFLVGVPDYRHDQAILERDSNAKVDALIEQIDREVDPTKRQALIREVEAIYEQDPPLLPVAWEKIDDIWYDYVKGLRPDDYFGAYDVCRQDTFWLQKT